MDGFQGLRHCDCYAGMSLCKARTHILQKDPSFKFTSKRGAAVILGFVDVTNLCIQFINQVSCFGFSSSF
jgi:hypothetical protein